MLIGWNLKELRRATTTTTTATLISFLFSSFHFFPFTYHVLFSRNQVQNIFVLDKKPFVCCFVLCCVVLCCVVLCCVVLCCLFVLLWEGEGATSYGFITNCSQGDFLTIKKMRAHVGDSIFTYRNVAGIDVVIVVVWVKVLQHNTRVVIWEFSSER